MKINIKKLRLEAGFTQRELAKRAGLSEAYISKMEAGKYNDMSLSVAEDLAAALGLNKEVLLTQIGYLEEKMRMEPFQLFRGYGFSVKQTQEILRFAQFIKEQK